MGRQRYFPIATDRVETAGEVGVAVRREETDRMEPQCTADTLWVLSDLLDEDFGRTVEASSVLHAIGDSGLSRGGWWFFRASSHR